MRKPANRQTGQPVDRPTGQPAKLGDFAHTAKHQHAKEGWAFGWHLLTDANDPSLRPVFSSLSDIPSLSASQMEGEARWVHLPIMVRAGFGISPTPDLGENHATIVAVVCWFANDSG
jgi:hypothetical protein